LFCWVYHCDCKDGYCGMVSRYGEEDFLIGGKAYRVLDHGGWDWGVRGRVRKFVEILHHYAGIKLLHENELWNLTKSLERKIDWGILKRNSAYSSPYTAYYYLKDLARAKAIGDKRRCAWCRKLLKGGRSSAVHDECLEAWVNDYYYREEMGKWARKQKKLLGKMKTAIRRKDHVALRSLRGEFKPAPTLPK
jgi:hypothetical protein